MLTTSVHPSFLPSHYRYTHFQDMWTRRLYIKHNFLGEILDFLGKRLFFNTETGDTEKCSEQVVQGLLTIFKQSENSF